MTESAPSIRDFDRIRPDRTALLLIDFSNDFVDPRGKAAVIGKRDVSHAAPAIARAAQLLAVARARGVTVIHCLHTTLLGGAGDSPVWRDARSRATYSATDICLDGTWGQQPVDDLAVAPGEVVVKKLRYGAFTGTELELVLRSSGLDTVVCAGVSTNVCVDTTAREAFAREFYVHIVEDACASWDMTLHAAALRTAAQRFATVASASEYIDSWRDTAPVQ
jgi:nicotinamidase-related amidase